MYIIELFLLFGICLFTMLEQAVLVSSLFQATFVLLILALTLQLAHRPFLNKLHVLAFSTIILALIHVTIGADSLSFGYYKKIIMFSCTILAVPLVDAIPAKKKTVNWVLGINLAVSLLYVMMYWGVGIRGYTDIYLTLNFPNPNTAAMFLFHSILYCAVAVYYYRSWILKLLAVLLAGALFWLVRQTGCRSVLLALMAFVVFAAINIVLRKGTRIPTGISFLLVISPLIIAFVYMSLVETDVMSRWFSSFVGRGKTLSSRENIWLRAWNYYMNAPILGAYNGISYGTGTSQLHNTHLDVLTCYGTVPFILFISVLHRGIKRVLPMATTGFSRMCIFAFCAVLFQGSFEAALVSGGTGLYLMSFGFLLLAKSDHDIDEPRENADPTVSCKRIEEEEI